MVTVSSGVRSDGPEQQTTVAGGDHTTIYDINIPALRWDVRDHSRSEVKMGVNIGFLKMFTKRWHLTRKA